MYCSKCGVQNTNNEQFCKNCGTLLNSEVTVTKDNTINQTNENNINEVNKEQLSVNEINKNINVDTKKYAIISIVTGAGGIFLFLFVGMSLWLSVILSALGFNCARKSVDNYKGLATLGYVLNGLLLVVGIIIYISVLVEGM